MQARQVQARQVLPRVDTTLFQLHLHCHLLVLLQWEVGREVHTVLRFHHWEVRAVRTVQARQVQARQVQARTVQARTVPPRQVPPPVGTTLFQPHLHLHLHCHLLVLLLWEAVREVLPLRVQAQQIPKPQKKTLLMTKLWREFAD